MSSEELVAGTNAVEAKLAEHGLDEVRRHSFADAPETASDAPAETGQPRDDQGRFTTTQTEVDPEAIAAAEGTFSEGEQEQREEPQSGQDPAVAALLAKYGGNVDKALEAAVHAQRRLGERSSEVGDLRAQAAEQAAIIAELQGLRQDFQQARSQVPMDQATVDWFDQQVMERPQQALEWAQQSGNQMLVQRGLDVWKEVDPYGAAVHTARLEQQQMFAQIQAQQAAQARIPQNAGLSLALQNVLSRNPQFTNYSDHIDATLKAHPGAADALEAATQSGDSTKIERAIETLYSLAVGDTLQKLALQPSTPEADTTVTDVAVPSVAETRDPPPEPTPLDQFREQFRQEAERLTKGAWVA